MIFSYSEIIFHPEIIFYPEIIFLSRDKFLSRDISRWALVSKMRTRGRGRFFFSFLVALVMFSSLACKSFASQDYKPKHSMVRVNSLNCYVATPAQSTTKGVIMFLPQFKLSVVVKIDVAITERHWCVPLIHLFLDGLDPLGEHSQNIFINCMQYSANICTHVMYHYKRYTANTHWIKQRNASHIYKHM